MPMQARRHRLGVTLVVSDRRREQKNARTRRALNPIHGGGLEETSAYYPEICCALQQIICSSL